MNKEQSLQVAAEFLNGAPDVFVNCSLHQYFPSSLGLEKVAIAPPNTLNCKHCWEAYYLVYFASLPPHMRKQRLEELEFALHHAAEAEKKGQFDFKPFRRPEIGFEKE